MRKNALFKIGKFIPKNDSAFQKWFVRTQIFNAKILGLYGVPLTIVESGDISYDFINHSIFSNIPYMFWAIVYVVAFKAHRLNDHTVEIRYVLFNWLTIPKWFAYDKMHNNTWHVGRFNGLMDYKTELEPLGTVQRTDHIIPAEWVIFLCRLVLVVLFCSRYLQVVNIRPLLKNNWPAV